MEISTESVNKYLESVFNKKNDDLLISDLLSITFLTLDGIDEDDNEQVIYFKDLEFFKNLKYLEIANVTIDNSILNILSELAYLESIIFRNCIFSKQVRNLNKLSNIKNIRIINCDRFNISFLKKLTNLERLYISNKNIDDLSKFKSLRLEALDISECDLKNDSDLEKVNTNYLVISSKQYKKFEKKINDLKMRVMVMADPSMGYYIEKWIN